MNTATSTATATATATEKDEKFLRIGITCIVKKKSEIPADELADLYQIFEDDPDPLWGEREDNVLLKAEKILKLPKSLPADHKLSENMLVVCESHYSSRVMAFIIDIKGSSMFHVFTRTFDAKDPFLRCNGYAVTGCREETALTCRL